MSELLCPVTGEVWRHIFEGTNRLLGIYLVVQPPRVYAPPDKPQVEQLSLLDLERGHIQRFNLRVFRASNGWARVTHIRHLNKLCTWKGSVP